MSPTASQNLGQPLLLEDYTLIPQPVTASDLPLCAICRKQTPLKRCSTCKSIHYCSAACQTTDWLLHRLLCKQSTTSSRPGPSYRRALYLPDKSDKPRFIWLEYGDDGMPRDKMKAFPGVDAREVKTIGFHNRYLPYWLQISYDGNVSRRPLFDNQCVQRMLGDANDATISIGATGPGSDALSAAATSTWRGPLVVIAYDAAEGLGKPALDVDLRVLGPMVGYLRLRKEYEGPVFVEQPQEWWSEEDWKNVLGERR